MSLTGSLGAASQIKGLPKIVKYIIMFLVFVGGAIILGVAGLNSSISWIIGLFLIGFGTYGTFMGKFPYKIGLVIIGIGAVVTIINPSQHLTIGDTFLGELYRGLGLTLIRIKEVIF